MSELYQQTNYVCPTRYVSGRIIEYDIKSSNISCLRHCNMISEDEYIRLSRLPKQQREIEVGLMKKNDPNVYTKESETTKLARQFLLESNNIDDMNVIRIANDALFINTPIDLANMRYGNYIEFKQKSIYNIFLKLSNDILFFIGFDMNGNINVDVKGIKNLELHQDFVSLISYTVTILERAGVVEACRYLSEFISQYLTYQLPCGYYKEFNSYAQYRIKNYLFSISNFNESDDKRILDITYNYTLIRELWSILVEIYSIRSK